MEKRFGGSVCFLTLFLHLGELGFFCLVHCFLFNLGFFIIEMAMWRFVIFKKKYTPYMYMPSTC